MICKNWKHLSDFTMKLWVKLSYWYTVCIVKKLTCQSNSICQILCYYYIILKSDMPTTSMHYQSAIIILYIILKSDMPNCFNISATLLLLYYILFWYLLCQPTSIYQTICYYCILFWNLTCQPTSIYQSVMPTLPS